MGEHEEKRRDNEEKEEEMKATKVEELQRV